MSSDRGSGSSYAILKVAVMRGMMLFSDLICNYSVRKEADSHTNIRIMASELETDDITDQSLIRPLGTELLHYLAQKKRLYLPSANKEPA